MVLQPCRDPRRHPILPAVPVSSEMTLPMLLVDYPPPLELCVTQRIVLTTVTQGHQLFRISQTVLQPSVATSISRRVIHHLDDQCQHQCPRCRRTRFYRLCPRICPLILLSIINCLEADQTVEQGLSRLAVGSLPANAPGCLPQSHLRAHWYLRRSVLLTMSSTNSRRSIPRILMLHLYSLNFSIFRHRLRRLRHRRIHTPPMQRRTQRIRNPLSAL